MEEALYDSPTLRQFVEIDLGSEPVPDETTVCKFRHLLEEHDLGEEILGMVNLHLQALGVRITTGTIVDATIIHAPSSIKNRDQSRDPEIHQTRKGKQWYFGMKAQVGVDSKTKSFTPRWRPQPTLPMSRSCPICCTEKRRGCGATRLIRANRSDPRGRTPGAGFQAAALPVQRSDRGPSRVGEEPDEVEGAGEGRACVSSNEAEFGFGESALSGTEEDGHRLFVTCALVNLFVSRGKLLAKANPPESWQHLADRASKEIDPEKLSALVAELDCLLDGVSAVAIAIYERYIPSSARHVGNNHSAVLSASRTTEFRA